MPAGHLPSAFPFASARDWSIVRVTAKLPMQPGASADYQIQIDSDLAHRSLAGGFVYLGFVAALWAATDYASAHRALLLAMGGMSLVFACARFLLGHRFARLHAWNARIWRLAF